MSRDRGPDGSVDDLTQLVSVLSAAQQQTRYSEFCTPAVAVMVRLCMSSFRCTQCSKVKVLCL